MSQVLVHIQANLADDLRLRRLSRLAGYSEAHFHRLFVGRVGETPRQYTERLRVERAAVCLCLHDTTVLRVALEVGYQNHETFIRAFKRRFGVLPGDVRRRGLPELSSMRVKKDASKAPLSKQPYTLSDTRLVFTRVMDLAFIRHVGPYELVPAALFGTLQRWASSRELGGHRPLLGIGHDAPGITPAQKLRFDAALLVDGPFESDEQVQHQRLSAGQFAVTTHVGHYTTLADAYRRLFNRISRLPSVRPAGPPAIEVYHENRINADVKFNHTDIYLPVSPRTAGQLGARSHP